MIANQKRGGARGSTKRSSGRRNNRTVGARSHPGVAIMAVNRGIPLGFPDKMITRLRYAEVLTLTSTLGSIGKQVFRLNSTFDPDSTGIGHQPLYRDTFAGIYDQYAVISAVCRIKFVNPGTDPVRVGVVIDDDSSTSTTINTLVEQTHGQSVLLPAQAGSLSTHTFNVNWDCKKILGIDPYSSQSYKTAVGANPSEESDLLIWFANALLGTSNAYFEFEMIQTILWTELTTPTQS